MKEKKRNTLPALGICSLLVIFSVLCLTVFAILAVSTVQADGRIAERSYRTVSGYYEADCQAETILARLRQGDIPEGVRSIAAPEGGRIYTYTCEMTDTMQLKVEVLIGSGTYRILRWQAEFAGEWEADESLNLWEGE